MYSQIYLQHSTNQKRREHPPPRVAGSDGILALNHHQRKHRRYKENSGMQQYIPNHHSIQTLAIFAYHRIQSGACNMYQGHPKGGFRLLDGPYGQGRLQDSPKKSALPSTCFRGSRRASRFITCGEITKNQVDDREHYVEQQVKQKCSHQHRNEAIKTKIIMKLCTKTA